MAKESVKIDTKVLDRVRVLAKRNNRPLSWEIELLLEAALTSKNGVKEGAKA